MGNKIAFMGVGAVGGYAGAHMAQVGEDVTFIDPWPAHVEKMQRDGLKISHIRDVPEFTTKVRAMHLTDAQQLAKERPIDIAFVCMKLVRHRMGRHADQPVPRRPAASLSRCRIA